MIKRIRLFFAVRRVMKLIRRMLPFMWAGQDQAPECRALRGELNEIWHPLPWSVKEQLSAWMLARYEKGHL